jgi:hypothetical protein
VSKNQLTDDRTVQAAEKWVRGIIGLFIDPFGFIGKMGGPEQHRSHPFTVTSSATSDRVLRMVDDLHPGIGRPSDPHEPIPKESICFEPPSLGTSQASFRITIDTATVQGHPGGTYWGSVSVTDAASASTGGPGLFSAAQTIPVWIVIP